jgi:hypothetical protein
MKNDLCYLSSKEEASLGILSVARNFVKSISNYILIKG